MTTPAFPGWWEICCSTWALRRPVLIFQHYGWDPFSTETTGTVWWNDTDRAAFLSIIKNYNVQVIFTGHDHKLAAYKVNVTDSAGRQKVIDDIAGGTGGQYAHGEFFVVRLTDQFIDVMPVQWLDPAVFPNRTDAYPTGVGSSSVRPGSSTTWRVAENGSGPRC